MATIIGQKFREIRNKIFAELLQNKDLIRAIVVDSKDFINATPIDIQQELINNPKKLIRNYIYPYKKMFDTVTDKKVIITTELTGFKKANNSYRNGMVTFYILTPTALEDTNYGVRHDYIGDIMETIFANTTIGEFNFIDRGDIDIGNGYIGHYVSFQIVEFHIVR